MTSLVVCGPIGKDEILWDFFQRARVGWGVRIIPILQVMPRECLDTQQSSGLSPGAGVSQVGERAGRTVPWAGSYQTSIWPVADGERLYCGLGPQHSWLGHCYVHQNRRQGREAS